MKVIYEAGGGVSNTDSGYAESVKFAETELWEASHQAISFIASFSPKVCDTPKLLRGCCVVHVLTAPREHA